MPRSVTSAVLVSLFVVSACSSPPPAEPAAPAMSQVERGRYMVTAGGCNDCHTPAKMGPNGPEPDEERLLSGHPEGATVSMPKLPPDWLAMASPTFTAWAGPWGVSFTANLTPDENTGLGVWTEDVFVAAIREGKHMGTGRPILPPMPWPQYRNLTDDDLKAIFAYLRSIKPIHNRVPDPIPPTGGGM